ncbi:L-ascorbate metabolism protein UlaG (beta-lactamase superfamily) [Terracoccus luteus]|uniref:L-ascorbate metabolism protein UlaG (Beta-lactamase superfamily) n=1 Tax=Terracoccus luteus TaxID=53356 RepID=A0A495XU67_9MICO|nr:MBL fold metallo-hydrolase [Terracoccus luteus]RKT77737.1 L-ascorbate metabolism protein UlaG (beta-lactamase superfamily) [Terracoccus luteus]
MRVTHLGHACLLVEAADRRILVDPGNLSPAWHDLEGLDAVLVTHNHPDHLDLEAAARMLRANPGAAVHTDTLSAQKLGEQGLDVTPTSAGEAFTVGDVSVTPVGELHAFNHEAMPRIPNVGYVLRADGEPSLFHPGDAYDADPGEVDVLAHPLSAPWAASRDSIAFVARIAPSSFLPVHDALLSPVGRTMYATHVQNFSGVDDLTYHDLHDGESATF